MSDLHAYMGWDGRTDYGPEEGAVLIFARNRKEARRIGYKRVPWFDGDYIGFKVQRLPSDAAHLRREDGPHVVDNPPVCLDCEQWSAAPLDEGGRCEDCAETHADDQAAGYHHD